MKNTNKKWIVLNIAIVLLLSLGLSGCSGDDPVQPETSTEPTSFAETETYREIAALDGGTELLAQIPQAEKRRRLAGTSLFLAYFTNTIEPGPEEVEFPLNSSYFRYEGFGFPLGMISAEGPSIENFITLTQDGSATLTGTNGDQLTCDYHGTFTMDQVTGVVEFSGDVIFSGGTGRYQGASGTGGYIGTANVFEGAGKSVWYGHLELDD